MAEHEIPRVLEIAVKHISVDHTAHSRENCPWASAPGTPCSAMEALDATLKSESPHFKIVPATLISSHFAPQTECITSFRRVRS